MRLGSYELTGSLGRGGMGTVFRAHAPDGRAVAVKLLARRDDASLARFDRERRLLAGFTARDGFVPLLDAGTSSEGAWLAMPLLEGGTLRERLRRGPLGLEETIALGRALAAALGRAHARGIVHRDVKPENVLFDGEGHPLLADLGLAKHFAPLASGASQSVDLSLAGELRGTAGYMAPEQMEDASAVGPAADVFALGVVLYECLAGESPFVGVSSVDALTKAVRGDFQPLEEKREDAPPWLVAVVERSLSRRPEQRHADGAALARALAAPGRPGGRRSVAIAVALLVLAGGSGASALAWRARRRAGLDALVASGAAKLAAHDARGAVLDLTRALDEEPGLAIVRARRSLAYLELHDTDHALSDAHAAVSLEPGLALAWDARARARYSAHDLAGTVSDADRALALDPSRVDLLTVRAAARRALGDVAGALRDTDRAIELAPSLATGWSERGYVRYAQGDRAAAIADMTRALELDPKLAKAWETRAFLRGLGGDAEGSLADAERALELDPTVPNAWSARATAWWRKGNFQAARDDYTRALELEPRNATVWANRGLARGNLGDMEGAVGDSTRALELDAKLVDAWATRAHVRGVQGRWDDAIVDATRALELDPGRAAAVLDRAMAYDQKDEPARAIADFERYLELAPNEPNVPQVQARLEQLRAGR